MSETKTSSHSTWIRSMLRVVRGLSTKLNLPYKILSHPKPKPDAPRYEACDILSAQKVPHVIWFEDVLKFYGGRPEPYEVYILVDDPESAACVLAEAGYQRVEMRIFFPVVDDRIHRGGIHMRRPEYDRAKHTQVLIDAQLWRYNTLCRSNRFQEPLPPLNEYLNSLMTYWLELSKTEYLEKVLWAETIGEMICWVYKLKTPGEIGVNSDEFTQQLRPELHELHFDLIATYPGKVDINEYQKHEYHRLRYLQIKDGKFMPTRYPHDAFPPSIAEYPDLNRVPEMYRETRKSTPAILPLTSTNEPLE